MVSKILHVPYVASCSEAFDMIEIDIEVNVEYNREQEENPEEKIRALLKELGIINYCIHYVSRKEEPLANCGEQIETTSEGTLGGFAHAYDRVTKKNGKVALFSRHVALDSVDMKLYCNSEHIGNILDPRKVKYADIALAKILKNCAAKCNQVFKTIDGDKVQCPLLNPADFYKYKGAEVHIWGARSNPGVGTILNDEFKKCKGPEGIKILRAIKIQDKSSKKKFAIRGDSGSIVCISEKHGRKVKGIGMLVCANMNNIESDGERKIECVEGHQSGDSYTAFEINFGISKLEEAHDLEIKWIDETSQPNEFERSKYYK